MSFNSLPLPVLTVHETETDKTEEQDDIIANKMAEQDINQNLVRVSRTVTVKSLSETSVLVARSTKVIVQLYPTKQLKRSFPRKVACGVMNVYRQRRCYVIVANALTSFRQLASHHRVATTILALS